MTVPADAAVTVAVVTLLERARRDARPIATPPELTALGLDGAYALQDATVALREAGGAVRSGWKLGITSPVKQRVMGINHPLFGRIFAEGERPADRPIAHAALIAPRTEPELAIGLREPITPAMDRRALAAAVAWIAPALEITSSRYVPGTRTAVELVADNTSAGAYVIGPRVALADAPPIDAIDTALVRNGDVVLLGSTRDVLDHPLNALAALAEHLAARGLSTRAGDIVLSGAITDAIPVAPGDVIEARLSGLGVARATFA
jgi:2-keto-4-pentenoate hydratase